MSFRAKRELLMQIAPRYQEAPERQKGAILNEFVAATGYTRKYAIRLLNHPGSLHVEIARPRARHYGHEVQEALHLAWTAANHICAKRPVPFLPTLVESLEHHGHLQLTEELHRQLLSMSPATADRLLRPYRTAPRGITTTRGGTLLKRQIPVRTFEGWNDSRPGFLEADLVAHCGTQAEGAYLYTLTLTDVATGWTECVPLFNRDQASVTQALERVRQLLPFPLLGLDTDNGGELINAEVLAYCEREHITFTRGRSQHSNDQCFVEQKNGAVVRQVVGYDRFAGAVAHQQLTELYRALRLYVNCFQPSMKLQRKERQGSHVQRTYDQAQTPVQRLLASGVLSEAKVEELQRVARVLDPMRLLSQLEHLQHALWRHVEKPSEINEALRFEVKQCAEGRLPEEGITAAVPSLSKQRRKERKDPPRPHDWRTRPDPFEGVWEQTSDWLAVNPERTGVSIFQELQQLYPGRFRDTQLRTLQRGLVKVRASLIVTFDDHWSDELISGELSAPVLHAVALAGAP